MNDYGNLPRFVCMSSWIRLMVKFVIHDFAVESCLGQRQILITPSRLADNNKLC